MKPYVRNVTIECADPLRLAAFWSEVLGWMVEEPSRWTVELLEREQGAEALEEAVMLVDPEGLEPRLYFQRVDTPERGPNRRMHFDITVDDAEVEVERLTSLGAKNVRWMQDRLGPYIETWAEIEDPEGNLFTLQTEGATELP